MTAKIKIQWLAGADTGVALPKHETAQAAGADVRANFAPDPNRVRDGNSRWL